MFSCAATLSVFSSFAVAQTSPQLSSWYTAQSGKYARIVETDAELTSNSTKTTWTRTQGPNTTTQALPVYAGPQQIDYSANYVYIRTPNLGTYTMGPWYNNAARTQLFVNIPKNQGIIYRIPRTAVIPTTKSSTQGLRVGGVMQDAIGLCVDGVAIFDPLDGYSYANGTEVMGGNGQWRRDAYTNEAITFDKSLAHQQNTGKYHNHANPIALRYQLGDNVLFNNTTKVYSEGNTSTPTAHSPIIGWMLDGLPLYGPYGYSSAMDSNSGVRRMKGGFVLRDGTTTGVDNMSTTGRTVPAWSLRNGGTSVAGPAVSTTYPLGRYIEDWAYLGDLIKTGVTTNQQGTDFDLNEYNVRYCVTPEFPGGTWAYFLNITSTGTPQFPYMINRFLFGSPTGGAVTSVAETVANHFLGGANRPLAITNTSVSGTDVSLTWDAVEGATYSVDASSNNSTWTSKATGLLVSNANAKSNTHTSLTANGTEYARVNRTGLSYYDNAGTVNATIAQTASTSFIVATGPLAISTASLLTLGYEGTPYTQTLTAIGGSGNYTSWVVTVGDLPDGLTLSSAGVISGTPQTTGTANFTVQVTDSTSATASASFSLTIETQRAFAQSATYLYSTAATVNGVVAANGQTSTAYYRYGTSTSYGSSTPVVNVAAGASSEQISANLVGLTAGTTYHVQLVVDIGGTLYYSADQTFTTDTASDPAWHSAQITGLETPFNTNNMADGSRTGVVHSSANIYYYKGTDNNIWCVYWTGSAWVQAQLSTDGNASDWLTFGTSYNLLAYQGLDGNLWCVYYSGSQWVTLLLGTPPSGVTVAGDVVMDNVYNIIYYRGSDANAYAAQWNGSQWTHTSLGGTATVGGSLAVDNVNHLLYYQCFDNHLWCYQWTGTVWRQVQLTATANVGGSVAVDAGGLFIYYRSLVDDTPWAVAWNGTAWSQAQLDATAKISSSSTSSSSIIPYTQKYNTVFIDENGQCNALYWNGTNWASGLLGDGAWNLTGGLSLQPSTFWTFARRSDGNVVLFYYY